MKTLRLFAALALVLLSLQPCLAGDVKKEGWHIAHVGEEVHITLDYPLASGRIIQTLKAVVDDKVVDKPEIVHPDNMPAPQAARFGSIAILSAADGKGKLPQGSITFIYRPDKRGTHRVEVLPVIGTSDGTPRTFPPKVFFFAVY